jgi:hypothetical protein
MRSTELLGLFWTLSIALYVEDKKYHNVSETGSVSVLRWMGQDKPTLLGPLERARDWVGLSCPFHLRTETDPVSETLWYFLSSTYKTMDKVQKKPNSSVQHTPWSESFQVYTRSVLCTSPWWPPQALLPACWPLLRAVQTGCHSSSQSTNKRESVFQKQQSVA